MPLKRRRGTIAEAGSLRIFELWVLTLRRNRVGLVATVSAPWPPAGIPSLAGLTILVVDDDPDTVEILVIFLKTCGTSGIAAMTATGALTYADEARKLDAVVTDIAMPGIDGVELAQKLRSNPLRSRLPVIALTGFYEDYPNQKYSTHFSKSR